MSISYPNIKNSISDIKLSNASYQLVSDLKYSKMYAISKNVPSVRVKFFEDNSFMSYNSYLIYCPNEVESMKIKKVYLPEGIYISKGDSTFYDGSDGIKNTISFKNNGSVHPACTIKLIDESTGKSKKITLTIGYSRIMQRN